MTGLRHASDEDVINEMIKLLLRTCSALAFPDFLHERQHMSVHQFHIRLQRSLLPVCRQLELTTVPK